MTRSRATSTTKAGQLAKINVVVLYKGSGSIKVRPIASNRL